jgi:membrane fusion protein (multidrug efflux system)
MFKKFLWALLGIIIVVPIAASIAGIKLLQFKAMGAAAAKMAMPPEPVTVETVREEVYQPRISAVGTVNAIQGTEVSTEADGVVRAIKFEAGTTVTAGAELVQLDADVERAQLRAAEATAENSLLGFKRAQELLGGKSIAQSEYDTAQMTLKQSVAQVENLKATIAKKAVRAPFSGKLGIRRVSVGQFLRMGSPVVSLQSIDPIYVDFSQPQQRLGQLAQGLPVQVKTDSYPENIYEGKITAIDPDVDTRTRSVRVQATLPNSKGQLRPGMFVTVDTITSAGEKVLFIPETAIQYAPYGDSVFIVEDTGKPVQNTTTTLSVRQQFVRLGARQGDYVITTSGVKVGERVVSTGGFKLRPGGAVVIDNTLAPKFSFTPKPGNT